MSDLTTQVHESGGRPLHGLRLVVVGGPAKGAQCEPETERVTVGSAKDNDLVLEDGTVSRYHVELAHLGDQVLVRDLGSTNGTWSGSVRISEASIGPGTMLRLGQSVLKVEDRGPLDLEILDENSFFGLAGRSPVMRRLMARIERAAKSDASVLITGETGSGKEVVATALHRASPRAEGPLEIVDCGALSSGLISSELFGHEKGAFTGADRQHTGAFERADGGTLFLDEIGELPLSLQQTLLGAIERKSAKRVGGKSAVSFDVRLVAATHRDLREEVNKGTFREDLYYRLAVVKMIVPPLRERREDIPMMIQRFLDEAGYDEALSSLFPAEVMDRVLEHSWPGNARELRNFVEEALALGMADAPGEDGGQLASSSSSSSAEIKFPEGLKSREFKRARADVIRDFEAFYLRALLARCDGNVSKAARESKIARSYLIEMLERHNLGG